MPQQFAWEKEYQNPQLVTGNDQPQKDVLRFLKFLRKKEKVKLQNLNVLDLGSGTGRNANYLAELGNNVTGFEISITALKTASERANQNGVVVDYRLHDISSLYPLADQAMDLVLDITSSNSLNTSERGIYLSEVSRVLKTGGHFFVRALCKDGDKNAKALLKNNPGPEPDTYILKDMNMVERVFAREEFIDLYSKFFKIIELTKKTNYARFKGQSYRRNYWLAYMKKKA